MPHACRAPVGALASILAGLLLISVGVASCEGQGKGPPDDQVAHFTKDGSLTSSVSGLPAARPGRPFQRRRLLLTSVRQFDNH